MNKTHENGSSFVFSGVVSLAIAGIAGNEARNFPLQDLQEGLGAAFFPYLITGCIIVLSLAQIVYGFSLGFKAKWPFEQSPDLNRLGLLFVSFVGFTVAFAHFGFLVPAGIFLVLAMRLLQAPWINAGIVGISATLIIYGIFVVGFAIPMP